MAYDKNSKTATMKYIKEKQQEVKIRFRKEDYEQRILPAIKKSGMATATFIKQAIDEKIIRDDLDKLD